LVLDVSFIDRCWRVEALGAATTKRQPQVPAKGSQCLVVLLLQQSIQNIGE